MNNTTSSSQGQSQLSQLLDTIHQLRDRRCDDWWMMSSIWPTVLLSTSYYIIVRHAGPWFMKDRQVAGHTCSQDSQQSPLQGTFRSPPGDDDLQPGAGRLQLLDLLQGLLAVARPLRLDLSARGLLR